MRLLLSQSTMMRHVPLSVDPWRGHLRRPNAHPINTRPRIGSIGGDKGSGDRKSSRTVGCVAFLRLGRHPRSITTHFTSVIIMINIVTNLRHDFMPMPVYA